MAVPFLACMAAVASFYHLPPHSLASIHAVEGGRVGLVSHNTNGTNDYGFMQVNSYWIAPIAARTAVAPDDVRDRLINDGCYNIAVAGMILSGSRKEAHGNWMRAVGYYHSHTPSRGQAYRIRVINAALALYFPAKPGSDKPRVFITPP